jgi:hypothetical protein
MSGAGDGACIPEFSHGIGAPFAAEFDVRKRRDAAHEADDHAASTCREKTMRFTIRGLAPERFAPLFAMTDAELAHHRALRCMADAKPGFPCRVSLADAEPGSEVILVNYEHLPVDSPYRASHAIYVSAAKERFDAVDVVPPALRERMLSLRAFDARGMMLDADVADGAALESLIARFLDHREVEYLHAHFARRGCFAARIDRA